MPLVAGSAPDFRTLKWPRATRSLALRPLTMVDADAAWAYRSDPDVTRYLSHGPLDLAAVQARHADRVARMQPGVDDPLLPVAIEDASGFVGDAMLRCEVQDARWIGWIGYALHPRVHGRGDTSDRVVEPYLAAGWYEHDPFVTLDRAVVELMHTCVERARSRNPSILFTLCGEQAGHPSSLSVAREVGIDAIAVGIEAVPRMLLLAAVSSLHATEVSAS